MYIRAPLTHSVCSGGQKRASGSLERELRVVVSCRECWELHSGPMQEQQVLLLAEPSLRPLLFLRTLPCKVLVENGVGQSNRAMPLNSDVYLRLTGLQRKQVCPSELAY